MEMYPMMANCLLAHNVFDRKTTLVSIYIAPEVIPRRYIGCGSLLIVICANCITVVHK